MRYRLSFCIIVPLLFSVFVKGQTQITTPQSEGIFIHKVKPGTKLIYKTTMTGTAEVTLQKRNKAEIPMHLGIEMQLSVDSVSETAIAGHTTIQHMSVGQMLGLKHVVFESDDSVSRKKYPVLSTAFAEANATDPFVIEKAALLNKNERSDARKAVEEALSYVVMPLKAGENLKEGYSWKDVDSSYSTTSTSVFKILSIKENVLELSGNWKIEANILKTADTGAELKNVMTGNGEAVFYYDLNTHLLVSYKSNIKMKGFVDSEGQSNPITMKIESSGALK